MKKAIIISITLLVLLLAFDLLWLTGIGLDLKYKYEPYDDCVPIQEVHNLSQSHIFGLIINYSVFFITIILVFFMMKKNKR